MGKFFIRVCLTAIAFAYLCPLLIPGFAFSGGIFSAIGYGLLFSLGAWLTNVTAGAFALTVGIKTKGYGMLAVAPIWLIGWWLLPSAALVLFSYWFPTHFGVIGWLPAFLSGLILLFVNALTSGIGSDKPCGC